MDGLILYDNPGAGAVRDGASEMALVALEISRHGFSGVCVLVSSLLREVVVGPLVRFR